MAPTPKSRVMPAPTEVSAELQITHSTRATATTPTLTAVMPLQRRLHSVSDAAYVLGFERTTVWEQIRLGRLRTVRVGRRRLVPTEYIEEYIEMLKRESDAA
ncbi:helix-turn-helix domain-containing protein [Streptomyces sp. NPDC093595]|uniref:helix-turn-helix domain-containing protein n=1 Tax=Streptomyces sp. NPDC093595 TaxID=3366045 RepID=UPI0038116BC3